MKTLKQLTGISFLFLFLFFLNFLSFLGCSIEKVLIRKPENLEILKDTTLFEKSIQEKSEKFKNLSGIARIKIKTEKKEISFNAVIALKNPDLLRIEILNPFKQVISFISSDGKNIYQTDLKNSRIIATPVSKASSEKFLGVPLLPQELLKIIAGTISFNKNNQGKIQYDKDNNLYVLTEAPDFGNLVTTYWVDSNNFDTLKTEVSEMNGNTVYEAIYSDYKDIDNYPLPEKIICNFLLKNTAIEIILKDMSLNTEMSPDLFNLRNPSGFKIIYQE